MAPWRIRGVAAAAAADLGTRRDRCGRSSVCRNQFFSVFPHCLSCRLLLLQKREGGVRTTRGGPMALGFTHSPPGGGRGASWPFS